MSIIGVVGERIDANSAAGHEIAGDLKVFGIHEFDQIFHDDVHAILMKIAVVAEGEEVQLERFALDHPFARDIRDVDVSEVGLSCFGTECGELRAVERNEVLVFGMFVREGFQHLGVIVVRVLDVLVSQEGYPLQFIFCSHKMFGSKPCFQF